MEQQQIAALPNKQTEKLEARFLFFPTIGTLVFGCMCVYVGTDIASSTIDNKII